MLPAMGTRLAVGLSAAALAGTFCAAQVDACSRFQPPAQRISLVRGDASFEGAVLVRITEAGYIQPAPPGGRPWQATAAIERVLSGRARTGTIRFGRSGVSTACDDMTPAPAAGDRWVLYLARDPGGEVRAGISYPLDVALRADPRLASLLR
jgi:hypothetical protein